MDDVRVLVVVEDDADMRMLVRIMFDADPRLEVVGEATTANEAVEVARSNDPGLIILDHFIEGDVMGLEAAPMLKEAAPHAKIILFTSHELSVEAAREPAIDAYLSKSNLHMLLPTAQQLVGLEPAT